MTNGVIVFVFVVIIIWLVLLTISHVELTTKVEGLMMETDAFRRNLKELNDFTKRADNFTSTFLDLSKNYNETFATMNERMDLFRNRLDDLESDTKSKLAMHLEAINKADKELSDMHAASLNFVKRYQIKNKCFV